MRTLSVLVFFFLAVPVAAQQGASAGSATAHLEDAPPPRMVPVDETGAPAYNLFPADTTFRGPSAPVNVENSGVANNVRALIERGAASGPNFAGRFTIVTWGCGTACRMGALVDNRTGAMALLPEPAQAGFTHYLDSRLLVMNPPENLAEMQIDAQTHYYIWTGEHLQEVAADGTPLAEPIGCGEAIQQQGDVSEINASSD